MERTDISRFSFPRFHSFYYAPPLTPPQTLSPKLFPPRLFRRSICLSSPDEMEGFSLLKTTGSFILFCSQGELERLFTLEDERLFTFEDERLFTSQHETAERFFNLSRRGGRLFRSSTRSLNTTTSVQGLRALSVQSPEKCILRSRRNQFKTFSISREERGTDIFSSPQDEMEGIPMLLPLWSLLWRSLTSPL